MANPKNYWKKGQSGNPNGRPKNPMSTLVAGALERIEKKRHELNEKGKLPDGECIELLDHFVELAYKDKGVLIAVMKKLAPDLKAVEVDMKANLNGNLDLSHLTDEELDARIKSLESGLPGSGSIKSTPGKKDKGKAAGKHKGKGNTKGIGR
jgi:hypothetical protein